MTGNQINYLNYVESNRHNVAYENELRRHNISDEQIRSDLNTINRAHYERSDDETRRSNLAKEAISHTSNIANLEQSRAALQNAATNLINAQTRQYEAQSGRISAEAQRKQAGVNLLAQREAARHNLVSERQQDTSLLQSGIQTGIAGGNMLLRGLELIPKTVDAVIPF